MMQSAAAAAAAAPLKLKHLRFEEDVIARAAAPSQEDKNDDIILSTTTTAITTPQQQQQENNNNNKRTMMSISSPSPDDNNNNNNDDDIIKNKRVRLGTTTTTTSAAAAADSAIMMNATTDVPVAEPPASPTPSSDNTNNDDGVLEEEKMIWPMISSPADNNVSDDWDAVHLFGPIVPSLDAPPDLEHWLPQSALYQADRANAMAKKVRRPQHPTTINKQKETYKGLTHTTYTILQIAASPIVDAPTLYPTHEEFAKGFFGYLDEIMRAGEHFGIVKVVPPPSWRLPFACDAPTFSPLVGGQVPTRLQPTTNLFNRESDNDGQPFGFGSGPRFTLQQMRAYSRSLRRRHFGLVPSPSCMAARSCCQKYAHLPMSSIVAAEFTIMQRKQLSRQLQLLAMLSRRSRKLLEARGRKVRDPQPCTPSIEQVEAEFWRLVEDGSCPCGCPLLGGCQNGLRPGSPQQPPSLHPWESPVARSAAAHGTCGEVYGVLYASDLDASSFGSGFPLISGTPQMREALARKQYVVSPSEEEAEPYRSGIFAGWNLNALPNDPKSVLRLLCDSRVPSSPPSPPPSSSTFASFPVLDQFGEGEVPGLTNPFVYIGSLFSAFCWHSEDHDLLSINYHHGGAPKVWYGCPAGAADQFESAVRDSLLPHLFRERPTLLHDIVTHVPPTRLTELGVPCCRVVQRPGEFIVTLPRAYHSGVNCGVTINEAVNVSGPGWMKFGTASAERYRSPAHSRSSTFSMERLSLHILRACETDAAAAESAADAALFLRRRIDEEHRFRNLLMASLGQPQVMRTIAAEPKRGDAPLSLPSVATRDNGALYGTRRAHMPVHSLADVSRLEAGGWPKGTLRAARAILQRRGTCLVGSLLDCHVCRGGCHLGVVMFPFECMDALASNAGAVLAMRASDANVTASDLLPSYCVSCAYNHARTSVYLEKGPPLLLKRYTDDELNAVGDIATSVVTAAAAKDKQASAKRAAASA